MGRVADFESELRKRAKAHYGSWHAVDLHNHTPASGDDYQYKGPDVADKICEQIKLSELSVIMFADHGCLPEASLTDTIAEKTGRLILRGVELNVFVDAWQVPEKKVDKNLFFHLLVGFDPDSPSNPEYWLEHIKRNCREDTRQSGGRTLTGLACAIDDLHKITGDANALVIPAHLHSTHDAFKSRSIDDIFSAPQFLRHAQHHFTALEVRSESTAAFFDGRHEETGLLHKSCVRSSDSHEPDKIGWRFSYVEMQEPTFAQLKTGLELPFRSSLELPNAPSTHVLGIHVHGQFLSDLWIALSPFCNAFIGVKGSGKTSLLESLRFVLGADVPEARKEPVNEHLNAILGAGGTVTALVKRPDGGKVLIERSVADKSFLLTFEDDRQERIVRPEALHMPAYILGWHEIEQAATDVNVRRLYMDTIAGKEQVRALTEEAEAHAAAIRNNHERASNVYATFRQLQQQVARLNELRRGLQDLTDANLIELKGQYQAATEHRESLHATAKRFRDAQDNVQDHFRKLLAGVDRRNLEGPSPLREPLDVALTVIDEMGVALGEGGASIEARLAEAVMKLDEQLAVADERFRRFSEDYAGRVAKLDRHQQELLESHRRVMEETKALPTLERERDKARQEVERLLRELIDLCDKVTSALDARSKLRNEKVAAFAHELEPFDVRISVTGLQEPQQVRELNQRYAHGAKLWSDLRSSMSGRLGHLSLKLGYEDLLSDLLSGYSVFFDHSEFGYFVTVFEDDDLRIALRVVKDGDFKPIDQLSAGQRCTAIFPVLLKQQSGPLVVDQPEDNLDNRHIAGSIAPVLLTDKRLRQVIFTSHNANLVVLSDPELIVTFESDGTTGRIEEHGFLATPSSPITKHVVEILDGGERALKLRQQKYGGIGRMDSPPTLQ